MSIRSGGDLPVDANRGTLEQLKEQMKLWEPPRLDNVIVATSGRFTTNAVEAIERHNSADTTLRLEM
jgi:hypothetical protein